MPQPFIDTHGKRGVSHQALHLIAFFGIVIWRRVLTGLQLFQHGKRR
jgi:hypothetical protein